VIKVHNWLVKNLRFCPKVSAKHLPLALGFKEKQWLCVDLPHIVQSEVLFLQDLGSLT